MVVYLFEHELPLIIHELSFVSITDYTDIHGMSFNQNRENREKQGKPGISAACLSLPIFFISALSAISAGQ